MALVWHILVCDPFSSLKFVLQEYVATARNMVEATITIPFSGSLRGPQFTAVNVRKSLVLLLQRNEAIQFAFYVQFTLSIDSYGCKLED